jgi:hypothetical protein
LLKTWTRSESLIAFLTRLARKLSRECRYIPIDGIASFKTAAAALILGKGQDRASNIGVHATPVLFILKRISSRFTPADSPALAEGRVASCKRFIAVVVLQTVDGALELTLALTFSASALWHRCSPHRRRIFQEVQRLTLNFRTAFVC